MAMREVRTTDDVYATLGRACVNLTESAAAQSLGEVGLVIQYVTTAPDAVVTTCLRPELQRTDLGSTNLDADVIVRGSHGAVQDLLLGDLNPFLAVDQGELAVDGEDQAFLRAYPLLRRAIAPSYREMLFGVIYQEPPADLREAMAHPQPAAAS
jgi:hypothetical protein